MEFTRSLTVSITVYITNVMQLISPIQSNNLSLSLAFLSTKVGRLSTSVLGPRSASVMGHRPTSLLGRCPTSALVVRLLGMVQEVLIEMMVVRVERMVQEVVIEVMVVRVVEMVQEVVIEV